MGFIPKTKQVFWGITPVSEPGLALVLGLKLFFLALQPDALALPPKALGLELEM